MTNKMDQKHIQLLEENLRRGHLVACKTIGGYWKIFTYLQELESEVYFQGTAVGRTIEESANRGLDYNTYSHQELFTKFTNEYKIVTRPPEQFKQGDLVEIIDTPELRKEMDGCDTDKLAMIGKMGLSVRSSFRGGDTAVYTIDKKSTFYFPYWAVAKCLSEEPTIQYTDDELIAEVKRRGLVEKTFQCKHVPGDVDYDSNPPLYLCKKCDELYK